MTARVRFTAAARADLVDAIEWYRTQAPHMVGQFREAVSTAVDRIESNPRQFPVLAHETRRAAIRRFPYLLIFREEGDATYVVAVFHTRRDPLVWQRR